jgi:hypothetical protein
LEFFFLVEGDQDPETQHPPQKYAYSRTPSRQQPTLELYDYYLQEITFYIRYVYTGTYVSC